MENAKDPQTDREFLLQLDQQINNLSKSIDRFTDMLRNLEEKKIAALEKRVQDIESWRLQIMGGWRLMVVLWTILSLGGIAAVVKYFIR